MGNSVFVYGSTFAKIRSTDFPIMEIKVLKLRKKKSSALISFEIKNCTLSDNTGQLVNFTSFVRQQKVKINIISTDFSYNKDGNCAWKSITNNTTDVSIANCTFKSNVDFNIQITDIHTVRFNNNLIYYNSLQYQQLIMIDNTIITFEGNNEFSLNSVDVIINLNVRFMYIQEGATLNISCNCANSNTTEQRSLIVFSEDFNEYLCTFQFLSNKGRLDQDFTNSNTINFSLVFNNNHNYTSILYGTLLHSCQWLPNGAFHTATPGDVYKKVIQCDTTINIIDRREPTYCYCDNGTVVDCFRDNFTTTPIYPGQSIPIKLTQVPSSKITSSSSYLWRDVSDFVDRHNAIDKPCKLVPYQPPNLKELVHIAACMPLFYRALTNTSETCFMTFSSFGATKLTYYRYYISFNQTCPPGFELRSNSCKCNKHLQTVFPTLKCNIDTGMLSLRHYYNSWIAYTKEHTILYVYICINIFCKGKPNDLQLDKPDTQCNGNRTGLHCGHCPPGLSAVFGSFKCKKCSNDMLWLLPVFFIAGILLVFCLFTLNLTVVDGKINGFIVYANLTVWNGHFAFPSHKNILIVLLSLSNLDLGIETCFYHGMTEYDKTWLQFVFPSYLLCIVGVLAIASRYSSYVERLTRKRVIPVIATIFLLSYGKILLVTAKVLVSFTTVHEIVGDNTETSIIWSWDSSIKLLGAKFIALFIICLLVVLLILMPMIFLLIFTKFSYRCRFVSNYLKPYLDAYQAPFKMKQCNYCGIELLIRPVLLAVCNKMLGVNKTLALYSCVWVIFLVYLCTAKPFRSAATAMLYMSYMFNLGCHMVLYLYFSGNINNTWYVIFFKILMTIAVIEFSCTVLYYLYTNHLYKSKYISKLTGKVAIILSIFQRFVRKPKESALMMMPAGNYEQLQEELLTVDPNQLFEILNHVQ